MFGYYNMDDDEEPCEVGDQIILNSSDYLGSYKNSDASIVKIYNGGKLYDVKCFDGKIISVSKEHFDTIDEFYKISKPECECGAKFTKFPNVHMFYCPMYKEIK